MRNTDSLTEELRRRGHAQMSRFALSRADRNVHVLDKIRDQAPLTRERAPQDLAGRDGTDRCRVMAAGSGVRGLRMVPLWVADPTRASNDACHPQGLPENAVDICIPDDLRWLDRAMASMQRQYPLRALVVRTEFTVSASQAVKARMVAEQYGGTLSVWQYRLELQRGVDWLLGKQAA
ncbi:TPA: hypothetical protein QDZ42_004311 [Stenotrophomonas maltophilia]|nr:hypothetical protein [Stenotrophomonas maltophilia]HDS1041307.1 hypothetical protein [Stenotrophomonas maltophilia]HDS1043826.1 hypothetical protein [Stenotrophomonas maltophilia]HDS1045610.1 hypothetical protein [Stenotrophomonas maltophilia]